MQHPTENLFGVVSKASVPIVGLMLALCIVPDHAATAGSTADIPAWLMAHVGEGGGEIAPTVLTRARALYKRKVSEGEVANPCYFAMDATRPNDPQDGRFYVICEAAQSFTAIPSGHGAGRDLRGVADFSNGRRCARNFGNAMDSELTTGGSYVTGEIRTSFKGYYRNSVGGQAPFSRSFIPFVGEGETANAEAREIGGHAAVVLKNVCLWRHPGDAHADQQGYVPLGQLVDYAGGRSNGCTSWSAPDAEQLAAMVNGNPTSLYIYPEAEDIRAITRHNASGGIYWNASCLREIGAPRYWPRAVLEPIIARYKAEHPASAPRSAPLCVGQ